MSTSPVINSLRRKRAEVAGLIREAESRAHVLRRDLAHIDATLKLFAPGSEPKTIKPLRPYRPRNRIFERKELSIRVLTALREAPDGSASLGGIVQRIMVDKGIAPEAAQTIRRLVMIVLNGKKQRGVLTESGETPPRWRVRP